MTILFLLVPISLGLGLIGLAEFFWSLKHNRFNDPKGEAERIPSDRYDDAPKGE